MQLLFLICVATTFIPYSLVTPWGFLSLTDIAISAMFAFASARIASTKKYKSNGAILALSFACYGSVILAQISSGTPMSSIITKYTVFLIIIPIAILIGEVDVTHPSFERRLTYVISLSGVSLVMMMGLQIARGAYFYTSDGVYTVLLFDQGVNKNALGSMLVFSTVSAVWMYTRFNIKTGLVLATLQILFTLLVGARSALAVEILSLLYLCLLMSKLSTTKVTVVLSLAAVFPVVYIVTHASGAFDAQLQRLNELIDLDETNVTTSVSRLLLWQFALDQIRLSPWFGNGYGTFSYEGDNWLNGMYEPHNNMLQLAYAGGLVGLLCFLCLFVVGFLTRLSSTSGRLLKILTSVYLLNTLVGIIWVRGDGHLFALLFFALTTRKWQTGNAANVLRRRAATRRPAPIQAATRPLTMIASTNSRGHEGQINPYR